MDNGKCCMCEFAIRDSHGRFINTCGCYNNCDFEEYKGEVKPWPIDQMKEMLAGAVMSKFATLDYCKGFREALKRCIEIMEEE